MIGDSRNSHKKRKIKLDGLARRCVKVLANISWWLSCWAANQKVPSSNPSNAKLLLLGP